MTVNLSLTDSLSVDSLNFEKHFYIFYGAQVLIPEEASDVRDK